MTSWRQLDRRALLAGAVGALAAPAGAATPGERLAKAAGDQVGVTTGYDPAYRRLAYPGGDVPRVTGVCADVVVRAARDGLSLDLQRLVHEDMESAFAAYPHAWGLTSPDTSIDHRRVLNLEAYWRRRGCEVWRGDGPGPIFPKPLAVGDILTWRAPAPHVALVVRAGVLASIVHNIGGGVMEIPLLSMLPFRATGHYRWPRKG